MFRLMLSIALALALSGRGARGQVIYGAPSPTEATDTGRQQLCRQITARLDTSTSASDLERARAAIGLCEMSGGPYIARMWHDAVADSQALIDLQWNTRAVRDQRIMDSVVAVARDPARPTPVRIAALNVLAAYANPSLAYDPLPADTLSPSLRHLLDGDDPKDGAVPLGTGTVAAVTTLYGELAASDPDAAVRTRAARLKRAFDFGARVAAGMAAEDPAKLSLTYVCGNKFAIRNANPVAVTVQYDVDQVPGSRIEQTVPAPAAGQPYSETIVIAPAAGPLRLFLNGELAQTQANGNTPCPQ